MFPTESTAQSPAATPSTPPRQIQLRSPSPRRFLQQLQQLIPRHTDHLQKPSPLFCQTHTSQALKLNPKQTLTS
ncbi:hypothetical protein U2F10_15055 [Leptothoe sp. EHU-05/26/07-4]